MICLLNVGKAEKVKVKSGDIHIVLASDDAYVQHLGVLLVSIFENNRNESIVVHLLSDNISAEKKEILSRIIENNYKQNVVFYEMNRNIFKDFPVRAKDHISIAAYYRLMLSDLLPQKMTKVLYLDCDMIVTGSLHPLWNTDLFGFALAAVKDNLSYMPETFERLSLPSADCYFNTGLLLINLDYWRKENIFEQAVEITKNKADILLWHDQDLLNILFHAHWMSLPYRWNVMNTLMRPLPFYTPDMIKSIDMEIKKRVVVHYTCAWKPWIYPCDNPLCFEYYKYLKLSPWKKFKPARSLNRVFKWQIHKIRVLLGLLGKGYREIEL
ncbi:glycosyltransferase family 8 protein [uncultured Parabacteroides sp.]|uniref:glycosyltransferase family 8 protein n=1 Tax=uncultured Parabacteroides sp. TaxID=512312 RepID=UPI0028063FDB|nr:glycosyltransferase family 8 protein [uncultured Parabacteroides sp.]